MNTINTRAEGAVLFAEIDAPPMNLLGPELVRDLVSLIRRAEDDDSLKVVVFKSADPDYFISHVDLAHVSEYRAEAAALTGEESIASLVRYLSACRLVTIAQIEGRVAAFPAAGQAAVKDRVNAISRAPSEDFRRDSDLFGERVRSAETQRQIQAAMKRALETRDAEMDLGAMLGTLGTEKPDRPNRSAAVLTGEAT